MQKNSFSSYKKMELWCNFRVFRHLREKYVAMGSGNNLGEEVGQNPIGANIGIWVSCDFNFTVCAWFLIHY
jgi:hypothetical protein